MPNFNVCGTVYPYPNVGDNPWGVDHIAWAAAVSACVTAIDNQVSTSIASATFTGQGSLITSNVLLEPIELTAGVNGTFLQMSGGLPVWGPAPSAPGAVPIGGYIPWDDFNGLIALDPGWEYADGTAVTTVGSPIFGQLKKDMSGAAIVGFGALGAGDIGTTPYSSVAVGNANNLIDIRHNHTMSHTHSIAHTHSAGSYYAQISIGDWDGTNNVFSNEVNVSAWTSDHAVDSSAKSNTGGITRGTDVQGTSGSASTSNSGGASTSTTGNNLSQTQNIQPRSYRFRIIVRVL